MIGTVLGGAYTVRRQLGQGGMGSVYQADHLRLPKSFAIKVLNDAVDPSSELYLRFRREAEVCCRLKHEHIVEVVDFNRTEDGRPYLVMELLEGEDLGGRLDRVGRLPLEQAADILGQVAAALAEAHAQGVVHRDLKPQNIYLCRRSQRDDFVKLVDFGISKIQGSVSVLTDAKALMGTPFYMSPEQTGGGQGPVDHRTDVYALGVIAYQMLTGEMPFQGDNLAQLVMSINTRAPASMRSEVPELPPALDAVIDRTLAKDPRSRYQTVVEFDHALQTAAGRAPSLRPATFSLQPDTPEAEEAQARLSHAATITGPPFAAASRAPHPPTPEADASCSDGPPSRASSDPRRPSSTLAHGRTTLAGATGQHDLPEPEVPAARSPRALLIGLAVAGAITLAVVAAIVATRGSGPGNPHATSPKAASAEAPGDAVPGAAGPARQQPAASEARTVGLVASRVVIRLQGLPQSARCRVNGRFVEGNPLVLDRSERPTTLLCEAAGHRSFSREVIPAQDLTVPVTMPIEGGAAAPRHTARGAPRRRPRRVAPPGRPMEPPARAPAPRPRRPAYDDVPVD